MYRGVISVLLMWLFFGGSVFAAPKLVTDSLDIDLGRIRGGAVGQYSLTVRNEGDEPLEIQKIQTSCPCLVVVPPEQPVVAPGGALALTYTYDTEDAIGERGAAIVLNTNDPERPIVIFELRLFIDVLMVARPQEGITFGMSPRGYEITGKNRTLMLVPGVDRKQVELLDIRVDQPGITIKTERIQRGDQWWVQAKFTIEPDVPLGPFSAFVEARARVDGEEATARIPLKGDVVGDVIVLPPAIVCAPKLSYRPGDRISEIMVWSSLPNRPAPDVLGAVAVGPLSVVIQKNARDNKHIVTVNAGTTVRAGPQSGTVYVMTASKDQPITSVPVHFIFAPELIAEPAKVVLSPTAGAPASQSVSIKNANGATVTLKNVRFETDLVNVQITNPQQIDADHPATLVISADKLPEPSRYATMIAVETDLENLPELLIPVLLRPPDAAAVPFDEWFKTP